MSEERQPGRRPDDFSAGGPVRTDLSTAQTRKNHPSIAHGERSHCSAWGKRSGRTDARLGRRAFASACTSQMVTAGGRRGRSDLRSKYPPHHLEWYGRVDSVRQRAVHPGLLSNVGSRTGGHSPPGEYGPTGHGDDCAADRPGQRDDLVVTRGATWNHLDTDVIGRCDDDWGEHGEVIRGANHPPLLVS